MIDHTSLSQAKQHRLELTGSLLSDLETRENLEEGVLERLKFGLNRSSELNKALLSSLTELSGESAWGIGTGYTIETLREEAEQKFIIQSLQKLYSSNATTSSTTKSTVATAAAAATAAAPSSPSSPTPTAGSALSAVQAKRDQKQQQASSSADFTTDDETNPANIPVPEMEPFTDLLNQLMHERVADELQPRLRNTIDRQFLKPLFPDEFNEKLTELARLVLTVSGVIIMANQADTGASAAGGGGSSGGIGGLARGNRRNTVFGARGAGANSAVQWRRKHQRIEDEIRELINPSSSQGATVTVGAGAVAGGKDAAVTSAAQLAAKVESLLDEDMDACEKWFDVAARSASDFVCDSAAQQQQQQQQQKKSGGGGGSTISSAFLLQTKEDIADAIQVLYEMRDTKAESLQRIRADELRFEEYFEAQNEEDLKARVAFRSTTEESAAALSKNFEQQRERWAQLVEVVASLQGLSAEANTLVRRHVSHSEAELERRQTFAEMQHAKETQAKVAERLRMNIKGALRLIETTAEFLGHGQAQITTAKVGAELSNGLRTAASSLHESYFEYAARLCRRINQYEQRIESADLVRRTVDGALSDIKTTKLISDEANSQARHLRTVRDTLRERLDAATEKLERHLGLHRSIRDAESTNHSRERPVTQRVRELEVMLREDVVRTLSGHYSSENVFLDVAKNRLEVATKMSGVAEQLSSLQADQRAEDEDEL